MGRLIRLIGAVGALVMPAASWAGERSWDGWGMHPMWGGSGMWGISVMVVMFVFWGLVIAGLVMGIRSLVTERRRRPMPDRALAVLRERYARGEIGKEEFDAKRRDLEAA